MFKIVRSDNCLNMEFSGKLDSNDMANVLNELFRKAAGIEHGRLLIRIVDFHFPTLGAMGVELSRIPELFRFIRKFDRAAVIAGESWLRKVSEFEGVLIPGLEIKAFTPEEVSQAQTWLADHRGVAR